MELLFGWRFINIDELCKKTGIEKNDLKLVAQPFTIKNSETKYIITIDEERTKLEKFLEDRDSRNILSIIVDNCYLYLGILLGECITTDLLYIELIENKKVLEERMKKMNLTIPEDLSLMCVMI